MERILRCFNPGPTGSKDDDTSFTLTVETFSFEELSAATDNFSSTLRIGSGGQATVYEGHLPRIGQVAVKWLTSHDFPSKQRAFLREVYVLNSTNHPHIVKLLGCCSEGTERLLVYEYVSGGTLRHRLSELNWYTRMRIARDAATVLEKLHLQSDPPIIHRDFKSDNILLSTDLSPKVSDFGIAKIAPAGDGLSAATSETLGTYGYVSPGIFRALNPTVMTDIYSFGVVLLEIITGKPAIDHSKEGDEHYLVHWAASKSKDGNFEEVLDPRLRGSVSRMVLSEALAVVDRCTGTEAVGRPRIREIIRALRHVVSISQDDTPGASSSAAS